jgi:hypothetical protein
VIVSGTEIRARISVADAGVREICLRTQEPRSPAELRGNSDLRRLGISIPTAPVGAANASRQVVDSSAPRLRTLLKRLIERAGGLTSRRANAQRDRSRPDPLP